MKIEITRAGILQAATIASIGKKSFRRSFEHLFESKMELLEYLEHTYDPVKLAGSLRKENNIYLLAFADGVAVGFAKLKLNSLNEQIESVAQVELQKIYVLHEFHGFGIGAALMKEIKWLVRDIYPDYIWLDTHISNEKAIQFYERNGFHKIGKYYFTIGTQVFEYHVMGLPVAFKVSKAC